MPSHMTVPDYFFIGARHQWWARWSGEIDDFRVYDYALNANQIQWIATDGTKHRYIPLEASTDLVKSGANRVNFRDYSVLADEWLNPPVWWP